MIDPVALYVRLMTGVELRNPLGSHQVDPPSREASEQPAPTPCTQPEPTILLIPFPS